MRNYKRILDLRALIAKKSILLLGPRSTGKSWLLQETFGTSQTISLLRTQTFLTLAENPSKLSEMIAEFEAKKLNGPIIIDEIQKLPILLDEVHQLIESKKLKFILTGSSARKLKRTGVNLLAGRAWQSNLFPLVSDEINDFDLNKYLAYGGLPQVYTSNDPLEELDAYVNLYLKEEIKEEALVQNLVQFSRFLKIASLMNTQLVNFANISKDCAIAETTVKAYFDVLKDTMIGFMLEPWRESKKRKAIAAAKFYFFDIGVANFLASRNSINRNSNEFGQAFEHFIAMELRAYIAYKRLKIELGFFRTQSKIEVDFVLGNEVAIEVKATEKVLDRHLEGLKALKEENVFKNFYLITFDKIERKTNDEIRCWHWQTFLKNLWQGKVI